jgi:hypothetical protein
MRQPDKAFVLCQMSSHLQPGAGCPGTPYRNIETDNSMRCRVIFIQFQQILWSMF